MPLRLRKRHCRGMGPRAWKIRDCACELWSMRGGPKEDARVCLILFSSYGCSPHLFVVSASKPRFQFPSHVLARGSQDHLDEPRRSLLQNISHRLCASFDLFSLLCVAVILPPLQIAPQRLRQVGCSDTLSCQWSLMMALSWC